MPHAERRCRSCSSPTSPWRCAHPFRRRLGGAHRHRGCCSRHWLATRGRGNLESAGVVLGHRPPVRPSLVPGADVRLRRHAEGCPGSTHANCFLRATRPCSLSTRSTVPSMPRNVRDVVRVARGKVSARTRSHQPLPNRNGAKVRHHCVPPPSASPQVRMRMSPARTLEWTRTSSRIPHGSWALPARHTRLRRSQTCDPRH